MLFVHRHGIFELQVNFVFLMNLHHLLVRIALRLLKNLPFDNQAFSEVFLSLSSFFSVLLFLAERFCLLRHNVIENGAIEQLVFSYSVSFVFFKKLKHCMDLLNKENSYNIHSVIQINYLSKRSSKHIENLSSLIKNELTWRLRAFSSDFGTEECQLYLF